MSLADGRPLDGEPLPVLPDGPPYPCVGLAGWRGTRFDLNPGHPALREIHEGGAGTGGAWDNLVGARRWWLEHPDWMDFLHPDAPGHRDKLQERTLYLDRWAEHLPARSRVLDLGGGIGRFTQWLLDRECDVELVDPDLRSLWTAVDHAVGRPGRLDVHWTTGDCLPSVGPVDVVLAAEMLCYVEDPAAVLAAVQGVLRPGGILLVSVEARYGWAMGPDVLEGMLPALDGDGVVHRAGDRWVQTYTEAAFKSLLSDFEIEQIVPTHYVLSGPFERVAGQMDIEGVRRWENHLRSDPATRPLNRAWMAVARYRG